MKRSPFICPLYLYPETEKPKKELSADKKKELECKVEEAQSKLEGFEIGFSAFKKVFNSVPNPDKNLQKLYQGQEKEYLKLQQDIEKLQDLLIPKKQSNGTIFEQETRKPNLNKEIVAKIAENLGLTFMNEKELSEDGFAPIDILDYIYTVLHSPNYREKYKEFLKIDFPRVPFPSPLTPEGGIEETQKKFWLLVGLGAELRQIHLLESPILENSIVNYPINGTNQVGKVVYEDGKVYINYDKTPPSGYSDISGGGLQYFTNVPAMAWEFFIGGYQPAQKWLKDRKDTKLEFEDILHYQKIIMALVETDKIMKEIDKIVF